MKLQVELCAKKIEADKLREKSEFEKQSSSAI